MPRQNLNRNISRLDEGPYGYQVRLCRQGMHISKLFSDSQYGGKRKALAAAREFRDKLIESLASKEVTRRQRAEQKKSNNSSGIPGIRFVTEEDDRAVEGYYEYYVAQWSPEPGVRRTKRFSVNKYGKKKALQLAKAARRVGVKEMVE